MIEIDQKELTIKRQCELLELPRSTLYYQACTDNPRDIELMHMIDEIYTQHPEYGSRRMRFALNARVYSVGRNQIRGLMKRMKIEAIYPKSNLSKSHHEHKIYPYLLREVKINRVNQVWSTDITYIRMVNGFLYLTAVIDWYSRYVLSWKISNSLDGFFVEKCS